jgi:nitrate/nitrite transport system ATP-binding protein
VPRPYVAVEDLARQFGSQTVFRHVWFGIEKGEFVCLIGHSGCGKTTILNCLAGLDHADAGAIIMDGQEVTGPALDRAVIFQGHALLPWLSALENIAFAVSSRHRDWPRAQVLARCWDMIELVGLREAADKRPAQLSGGMKQRVGIARALSVNPRMLLMDEPFSALDALTRGTLQDEVVRLAKATHQTCFMITHDVDEAILLADRILLMTNGPDARIAEVVVNSLPKPRFRGDLHRLPGYYSLRNHIVEFLVARSRALVGNMPSDFDPKSPPEIAPAETSMEDAG